MFAGDLRFFFLYKDRRVARYDLYSLAQMSMADLTYIDVIDFRFQILTNREREGDGDIVVQSRECYMHSSVRIFGSAVFPSHEKTSVVTRRGDLLFTLSLLLPKGTWW